MTQLTLRDVPAELHQWLKQQAGAHRRSLNQEVIVRLESLRQQPAISPDPVARLARIRQVAERAALLPVLDPRAEADILGYGDDGMPR